MESAYHLPTERYDSQRALTPPRLYTLSPSDTIRAQTKPAAAPAAARGYINIWERIGNELSLLASKIHINSVGRTACARKNRRARPVLRAVLLLRRR